MPVPACSLLKAGGFQAAGLEELGRGKGRAEGCVTQQPALSPRGDKSRTQVVVRKLPG